VIRLVLALLIAIGIAADASAHEVRPAYLELTETSAGQYDVTWKQPLKDGRRLKIDPVFPEACGEKPEAPDARLVSGTLIQRWTITCDLSAATISVSGLDRTLTDAFLRVTFLNGDIRTGVLKPAAPSISLAEESQSPARAYLRIGVDHIIFGPDHLLFVAGLVLLVSLRQIIPVATAFTLAHSLTLALTAMGWLALPGAPVEIMIAASILLLAVEVSRKRRAEPSLAAHKPWLIAFGIGLLHGCGFAGALAEIGLPKGQELMALFLFNVGVEIGQVAFICAMLAALWLIKRAVETARAPAELLATYTIGVIGAFWTIERLSAFLLS